jgi:hypothetical protein
MPRTWILCILEFAQPSAISSDAGVAVTKGVLKSVPLPGITPAVTAKNDTVLTFQRTK